MDSLEPLPARAVVDVATGVLVALRRCGAQQAAAELAEVAERLSVPVEAVAAALVAGAAGDGRDDRAVRVASADGHEAAVVEAVRATWLRQMGRGMPSSAPGLEGRRGAAS